MRTTLALLSGMAGLVAASPRRQMPDLGAIAAAPPPAVTAPPLAASNQTGVYNPTTADAVGSSVGAISVASATVTADVKKRNYGLQNKGNKQTPSTSSTSYKTTSTSLVKSSSISVTMSSAASSSPSASSAAASSSLSSAASLSSPAPSGSASTATTQSTPCAPQPDGYGPKVTPDTVDAFLAYPGFHTTAQNAVTPSGYTNTFKDLNAALSGNSYLGLHTLSSYDTAGCSQWCDNTTLCTGFNIYIGRDPSLNPTDNGTVWSVDGNTYGCPSPSSITNYKCTLWGSGVNATMATNTGGWRGNYFEVVVAGANGYEKTSTTTPPSSCNGGAINRPSRHIGSHFFPGPYDPSVCASYATAQTAYNRAHASIKTLYFYQPCNMFNAYMVKKNGKALGTYCTLYNQPVGNSYATYKGAWSGSDWFGLESSWTYTLSKLDVGNALAS